ncbi:hypothetical protein TWF694_000731 [Orbilia ellipsospora]|uniref:Uncharacterized protein n=1 Tax=Orbilia ellipsospora TaxID=2528407 RepID=A0AAV9XQZ7_9PEZI
MSSLSSSISTSSHIESASDPFLDTAYEELLKKHQCRAINLLIQGDLSPIDPLISDTSCEMRPMFVLDMHHKINTYFSRKPKEALRSALKTVAEYTLIRAADKQDTKCRTIEDVLGSGPNPPKYNHLIEEMHELLGAENVKLLGLCYSLSIWRYLAYDEFNTPFFGCPTDIPLFHKRAAGLRYELARLCVSYFDKLVRGLSIDVKPTLERNGISQSISIEQQLLQAVQRMRSIIPQTDGQGIEVMAAYPQFRMLFLHEYNQDRPIVISMQRIRIDKSNPEKITYTLMDARALYFKADKIKRRFALNRNPGLSQRRQPAVHFACWNTYIADSTSAGRGLDAEDDNEEYYGALERCDLSWLVMTSMADHPAFAAGAIDGDMDCGEIFRDICEPYKSYDVPKYTRQSCEGFHSGKSDPTTKTLNLHEEWEAASQIAKGLGLIDARKLQYGNKFGKCYERITRAVDFQIEHVRIKSFDQAEQSCKDLTSLHTRARAAGGSIGQFVVRVGSFGVSVSERQDGDYLSNNKLVNKKVKLKKEYLERFPRNAVFLNRVN